MDYRTLTKATSDGFANQPRKQEKKANEENMTFKPVCFGRCKHKAKVPVKPSKLSEFSTNLKVRQNSQGKTNVCRYD